MSVFISPSQIAALSSPAADAALQLAMDNKAKADAAALANTAAAAAAAVDASVARNNLADATAAAAVAIPAPPASFLDMQTTKQRYTDAISLYHAQHKALTAARDDLKQFIAKCNKRSPLISLPPTLRANFTSAHFVDVEGDATFYKATTDALKVLEQEANKSAYQLILAGKEKHIAYLAAQVRTQGFIARAVSTYTAYVSDVNRLYTERGSSTSVPLATAVAHFEQQLRRKMESYDAQQIQAALVADQKKREVVDVEMKAEEAIVAGAHNGANIAQIAGKAAKAELVSTKQALAVANRSIQNLQQQVNRLSTGAAVTAAAARPSSSKPVHVAAKSQGKKRKAESGSPQRASARSAAAVDPDAMSDVPAPVPAPAAPAKQSNSRGGGSRPPASKKARTGGNSGGSVVAPPQRK